MDTIQVFLNNIGSRILSFWQSIDLNDHPYMILDIVLVSIAIYYVFVLIKGTRAAPIFLGVVIIAFITLLSDIFQLSAFGWLLGHIMTMTIIAIPIVFRDEIRKGLERIGQMHFFSGKHKSDSLHRRITIIMDALEHLASKQHGCTIVLERNSSLQEFIDNGVDLNSDLSKELLITIFTPQTLLHDGAVIINGNKIKAASCTLPLSTQATDVKFGTRHKSALGLTEQTDAVCLIVSEERGEISLANNGALTANVNVARLERILKKILQEK